MRYGDGVVFDGEWSGGQRVPIWDQTRSACHVGSWAVPALASEWVADDGITFQVQGGEVAMQELAFAQLLLMLTVQALLIWDAARDPAAAELLRSEGSAHAWPLADPQRARAAIRPPTKKETGPCVDVRVCVATPPKSTIL